MVGFIRLRWAHSGPSLAWSGSFGRYLGVTQVHWVDSLALGFVRIICALEVLEFNRTGPGGRRISADSLGSFWRILGVIVGLIR